MDDQQADRYMTGTQGAAALTRTELAMIRATEAFSRWSLFLHKSVSGVSLASEDVWLLHAIRMCGGVQNLSELLLFLNRNDVSTIQYSLRKIEQWGLIRRVTGSSRREAGYRLTEDGMRATDDYAQIREDVLITLVDDINGFLPKLEQAAGVVERMTALYDQSTQTVLNRRILGK